MEHEWECSLPTKRRADKWAGIQVGGNEEPSQDSGNALRESDKDGWQWDNRWQDLEEGE